jgi:6-hydroxytryprostatin B O-methyltransferase
MALNSPSLKDLAALISAQSSKISDFVEKNDLPQLSFAVDGLRDRSFNGDLEAQGARVALIEAATDILHLAIGPEDYMKYQPITACPPTLCTTYST